MLKFHIFKAYKLEILKMLTLIYPYKSREYAGILDFFL